MTQQITVRQANSTVTQGSKTN